MTTTLNHRSQDVVARVEREMLTGQTFRYAERSAKSVPLGGPPINSGDWANMMMAVARFATMGDWAADVAGRILGNVSQYVTPNEAVGQVAGIIADTARTGWHDTRTATGPEPGRPSSHDHGPTLRTAILLHALLTEVQMSAGYIGHVPGPGWVLAHLIERENVQINPCYFPKVAAALAA